MWLLCRYENIVQIRCLYEGVTVDEMLQFWHDILPQKMQQWGLDRGKVSGDAALWSREATLWSHACSVHVIRDHVHMYNMPI